MAFLGASWVISETSFSDYFGEDSFQIFNASLHHVELRQVYSIKVVNVLGRKMKKLWKTFLTHDGSMVVWNIFNTFTININTK